MTGNSRRGRWNRTTSASESSLTQLILLLSVAMASFFGGTLYTMHSGIGKCSSIDAQKENSPLQLQSQVEQLAQRRLRELQQNLPHCKPNPTTPEQERQFIQPPDAEAQHGATQGGTVEFPTTVSKYIAGIGRTPKADFIELIDTGVPPDLPQPTDSDVLLLYQRNQALPTRYSESSDSIPNFETAQEALEHCDYLNVVLTDHSKGRNQCIAIMPQYESYHVQKWMRLPEERGGKLDSSIALRPVGRGMKANGMDEFSPPKTNDIQHNMDMLTKYFTALPDVLKELKPLVEKVATAKRTVTVMVSNFGQSELLVNFVCAAQTRNLDTSSILVFATDMETKELAEHLGLTAFYDERNFGDMPQEAAGHYGDRKFTAMMMAKVFCVQMVSALKYNILFQDVDIVWYKDPVEFFETSNQQHDIMFQDDGGHTVRYAPYSANSGFYYVRYNARTEYFFKSLLVSGDLIQTTDSHQQALIALLSDHSSLFGLRVKVFSRDTDEFPGGFQYNQHSGKYMKDFFAGEVHPYIFHMSWTLNKDNKLLYLRQMGEWFVEEPCVHKPVQEVLAEGGDSSKFISTCCAAEPLISCHYRDKPSKIPCKDSPPIDKGKPSFW